LSIKGSSVRPLIILIGDIVIIPISYLTGYWIRFGYISGFRENFPFWFIPLIILSYLAIFYFLDLYNLRKKFFTLNLIVITALSIAVAAVFVSFLNYVIFLYPIGRGILVIANIILLLLSLTWRGLCYQIFKYLIKSTRVVIAGTGKPGQEIARVIESSESDYEVLGFLDDERKSTGKTGPGKGIKVLGTIDRLLALAEKHKIDQLINTYSSKDNPQISKNILNARLKGIEVLDMPEMYQNLKLRIPINYVEESWFLKEKGFEYPKNIVVMRAKRIIDVFVSTLVLLISLPFWPIIALLIKINSRGPVFYAQRRVGQNEILFFLYKFRSMILGAEESGALWAAERDERITFVGKILRRFHLDELPQFWNVIKGEMSLVGPRPERPEFVEELGKKIPFYGLRHFLKPGITGWAQVNYPYASSLRDSEEKLEYDLYYVSHMNLLFDLRILLNTGQKILLGKRF